MKNWTRRKAKLTGLPWRFFRREAQATIKPYPLWNHHGSRRWSNINDNLSLFQAFRSSGPCKEMWAGKNKKQGGGVAGESEKTSSLPLFPLIFFSLSSFAPQSTIPTPGSVTTNRPSRPDRLEFFETTQWGDQTRRNNCCVKRAFKVKASLYDHKVKTFLTYSCNWRGTF